MSNVAPEHGEHPIGPFGDGGPIGLGRGQRPPAPSTDNYGTVSNDTITPFGPVPDGGPVSGHSENTLTDPTDSY